MLYDRVEEIVMEVVADDCQPLYIGQPLCSAVLARMRSVGYAPIFRGQPLHEQTHCSQLAFGQLMAPLRPKGCEIDPSFRRARLDV